MAHLALTIDPDAQRRRQFLDTARGKIRTLAEWVVEELECGDLAMVWGVFPAAPRSCQAHDATCALVLGDAILDDGQRLAASSLVAADHCAHAPLPVCDGFYLAAKYARPHGLTLSVDPLGLFPLYYAARGGVLIAATSCTLCVAHPCCEGGLDADGLAGILLTNGLVDDRPLVAGLRRLGVGCQLRWDAQHGASEIETYRPAVHDRYVALSFNDTWRLLDERVADAVHRHRPPQGATTLLLSGGLDSRMLAGYLVQDHSVKSALVLGRDTDLEVQAATQADRRTAPCMGPRCGAAGSAVVADADSDAYPLSHRRRHPSPEHALLAVAPLPRSPRAGRCIQRVSAALTGPANAVCHCGGAFSGLSRDCPGYEFLPV
ncbi:MAG: hypothetical protein ACYC3X_09495 [Pirellulaceae bacterium]